MVSRPEIYAEPRIVGGSGDSWLCITELGQLRMSRLIVVFFKPGQMLAVGIHHVQVSLRREPCGIGGRENSLRCSYVFYSAREEQPHNHRAEGSHKMKWTSCRKPSRLNELHRLILRLPI